MGALLDLTDQTFGRLTAIARAPKELRRSANIEWLCVCECGEALFARGSALKSGHTNSCGCLHRQIMRAVGRASGTHGHARRGDLSPTHISWGAMKQRCLDPGNKSYANYGGRGIRVCERWLVFENFLADMGERPDGMTLDRIDADGDYEPGNCRWADRLTQRHNRRTAQTLQLDAAGIFAL